MFSACNFFLFFVRKYDISVYLSIFIRYWLLYTIDSTQFYERNGIQNFMEITGIIRTWLVIDGSKHTCVLYTYTRIVRTVEGDLRYGKHLPKKNYDFLQPKWICPISLCILFIYIGFFLFSFSNFAISILSHTNIHLPKNCIPLKSVSD